MVVATLVLTMPTITSDPKIALNFRNAANMSCFQGRWIADTNVLSALHFQFPGMKTTVKDTQQLNKSVTSAFPSIFSVNDTNTSSIFACKFDLKIDGTRRRVTFYYFSRDGITPSIPDQDNSTFHKLYRNNLIRIVAKRKREEQKVPPSPLPNAHQVPPIAADPLHIIGQTIPLPSPEEPEVLPIAADPVVELPSITTDCLETTEYKSLFNPEKNETVRDCRS